LHFPYILQRAVPAQKCNWHLDLFIHFCTARELYLSIVTIAFWNARTMMDVNVVRSMPSNAVFGPPPPPPPSGACKSGAEARNVADATSLHRRTPSVDAVSTIAMGWPQQTATAVTTTQSSLSSYDNSKSATATTTKTKATSIDGADRRRFEAVDLSGYTRMREQHTVVVVRQQQDQYNDNDNNNNNNRSRTGLRRHQSEVWHRGLKFRRLTCTRSTDCGCGDYHTVLRQH